MYAEPDYTPKFPSPSFALDGGILAAGATLARGLTRRTHAKTELGPVDESAGDPTVALAKDREGPGGPELVVAGNDSSPYKRAPSMRESAAI